MDDLSPAAARQRKRENIQKLAAEWGAERSKLEEDMATNTGVILDHIPVALEAGLSMEAYAALVGVSRQTLYRWQDSARIHAEHHS
jgi:triphosphoribosyl-dephospho-CoA synthetase